MALCPIDMLIIVRVHTSCARIQPLCAILCRAYSRCMAPSELRSSAPCRRAMAAAASVGLAKSTKATGPELPAPAVSSRSRENPAQLSPPQLDAPRPRHPPALTSVCLTTCEISQGQVIRTQKFRREIPREDR